MNKHRLARATTVWPAGTFTLDDMRQGPLGDCYFVSVVGAAVVRNPSQIRGMVKPLEAGRFLVSFPSTRPVTVGPLTDCEIAMDSTTAGEGIWLAILEQAFAQYREMVKPPKVEVAEATDVIAHGGADRTYDHCLDRTRGSRSSVRSDARTAGSSRVQSPARRPPGAHRGHA